MYFRNNSPLVKYLTNSMNSSFDNLHVDLVAMEGLVHGV